MSDYDCIIVGAGAAGGIVAGVLCEAGKRVLLLERGKDLSFEQIGRDHVRNQRLSRRGVNAGPELEGNPRVSIDTRGQMEIVNPLDGGYENNAVCVGGGTRVFGAQGWRFMPQDFRMASIYGVPDGSSLADWPITYDDLEPYYDRAEWEIGACGDADQHVGQGPRTRGYPMPPFPANASKNILMRGARQLGWNTQPPPLLINTRPYHGRGACGHCSYCVGFACPTDAKNGTHNTMIRRALATGACDLVTESIVERVDTDVHGNVVGVTYLRDVGGSIERTTVTAATVVVSGGAVESPRLLLNSKSDKHPAGLGNAHDQVGRNLDAHVYVRADGLMQEVVNDGVGPGVTVATTDFTHGNDGIVGGGMLANDFVKLPIMFWYEQLPPHTPTWGLANKRHMRDYYNRTIRVTGPINNITHPNARVQVDPYVRDKYGIPVPHMSGHTHVETMRSARFVQDRAVEWLTACGAESIWAPQHGEPVRCGGQHQAGTCRMGNDPRTSVTDSYGRVHGHDNLFVVDGSLHVTMGGYNPVLTIMALAFRAAEHIASNLPCG